MPEQQLVEIARSLGAQARYLILDEPTASLTTREVDKLFDVIRRLRSQQVGIIYISHRLEELFEIADRVTVLRDGNAVETRPMAEADRATLIRLMAGREISQIFPKIDVADRGCCSRGTRRELDARGYSRCESQRPKRRNPGACRHGRFGPHANRRNAFRTHSGRTAAKSLCEVAASASTAPPKRSRWELPMSPKIAAVTA